MAKPDIRLPITRSIFHKLVLALSHTITSAFHILFFQTMFLVAFYGFFRVGELTTKTTKRRRSVLQFQFLSLLKPRSEVQAAKLVTSDYKHNTTGPSVLFPLIIIHRDWLYNSVLWNFYYAGAMWEDPILDHFFSQLTAQRSKPNGGLYATAQRSPCFLWLFHLQIALFTLWCS